jgi:nitrate reductase NapAB chaperone NapD
MPICSAVVAARTEDRDALFTWLNADPRFTLGPSVGLRTALVVEAESTAELSDLLHTIASREDVAGVLPVYHAFEDELPNAIDPRMPEPNALGEAK